MHQYSHFRPGESTAKLESPTKKNKLVTHSKSIFDKVSTKKILNDKISNKKFQNENYSKQKYKIVMVKVKLSPKQFKNKNHKQNFKTKNGSSIEVVEASQSKHQST